MNRVVWYVLLVFELWNVQNILGGNILGIFPARNKDDFLIGEAVVKGLLGNGHTITVLSHFPQQLPVANYKDINLSDCELKLDVNNEDVPYLANERIHREFLVENSTCSCVLAGCDYSELEEFDLLVVGMEYHSCFLHIGNPMNVPIIWVVSSNQNLLANSLTGDLDPLHPVMKSKWYRRLMEFLDRMKSFGNYLSKIVYYWQIRSYMTTVNRDLFVNVNTELVEKVDFVFYNTHFSIFPRPHVPNVIEIAGIHIEEEGAICPRVQQFMEDAENGVIFISTPTDEPSKRMFDEKMQTFEISFLRVAQSILWKRSAALRIPNYNLFRSDRLPQRQILNHENVIVFIGCASPNNIYEAVSSGTPMIGICCLPEQLDDMTRLEELGVGIALPYHSVNEVTVVNAVNLIWQDKSYARKMQKLSSAFNDRTMTPLNTAVYWAEYAIRHNGGSHLKSQASKMPLYSYLMLDFGPLSFIIGILYCYFGMLLYIKLYYWLKPKVLRYFKR